MTGTKYLTRPPTTTSPNNASRVCEPGIASTLLLVVINPSPTDALKTTPMLLLCLLAFR